MIGGEREVVKLSLGPKGRTLNVLPVGLDGETLTLVCPFPVLPLDMPVNVTLPGEEGAGPVAAVIRRVGIELMGDSELPRFKLQLAIESQTGDATELFPLEVDEEEFIMSSVIELRKDMEAGADTIENDIEPVLEEAKGEESVDEDEREDEDEDEVELESEDEQDFEDEDEFDEEFEIDTEADVSVSWPMNDSFEWPELHEMETLERFSEPDEDADPGDPLELEDDPPWAGADFEPPLPAEIPEPSKARWPIRFAVTMAFVISIVAVGYVMRQPLANAVAPMIGEDLAYSAVGLTVPGENAEPTTETLSTTAEEVETAAPVSAPADDLEALPVAADDGLLAEDLATDEDAFDREAAERAAEPSAEPAAPSPEPEIEAPTGTSPSGEPEVEQSDGLLRVVLPTQWPVNSATSYRLHDPTGIVIDVPGAMASERARWIDTSHDRVRSVRVLERNDGVRFIIYLNDEVVPRYRVGYSRNGVMVDILGPDPRHASLAAEETPLLAAAQ